MSQDSYIHKLIASISIYLMCWINLCSMTLCREDNVSLAVNQSCIRPLERLLLAINLDINIFKELAANN